MTVKELVEGITGWWEAGISMARQEKDALAMVKMLLSIAQSKDLPGQPFLWRDVKADGNQFSACRGTVLDVADPGTETCLAWHRLSTALKTYIRLSEGHCKGMEEVWKRYEMNPPDPLTKEACLQWIETVLQSTPGIFQRAIAAADKGEGLIIVQKEVAQ